MHLLIYGHRGWIGEQFVEICARDGDVHVVLGEARADDTVRVEEEIMRVKPTHVVSFIGRTHGVIGDKVYGTIDYLEQEGKLVENVRDNLYGPFLLAHLCTKYGCHFTYLGTGCIFEFDAEHPFGEELEGFTEESEANFFGSSYSIVKGFTDKIMRLYEDSVLTLRIRMPITGEKNPRNFITKITSYEKVCSIPNSMTVLPELLPVALDLMKNHITGIINFTNPGLISHNEMLEMYREIVDPEFTWKNFTVEEQNEILASKRSNNFLETGRLQTLYPGVKGIKESVRDMMYRYSNSM